MHLSGASKPPETKACSSPSPSLGSGISSIQMAAVLAAPLALGRPLTGISPGQLSHCEHG